MNFIEEFKKGQKGGNKGLPMGEGLTKLSHSINGLQRGRIYGIAAAPKAGKSTFVDYAFLIQPFLYVLKQKEEGNEIDIEWIYLSFELDRISKEFDFATYFLFHDYGIRSIVLPEGVSKGGETSIDLSPDYLRGRVIDDEGKIITVKESILEALKEVYKKRLIPLFGEYDTEGKKLSRGYIKFIAEKDNPTGIYKNLKAYAEQHGKFMKVQMGKSQRIIGYKPNNPNKYTVIITDHLRKLIPERGFTMKQTVDKYIEYSVELRNWCSFSFAHIIHTNRNMSDTQRLMKVKDMLFPTSDDIKDTGNLAEDSDYVFTVFNPNDEKYNLTKHFGVDIKDSHGNEIFPNLRTIHLVESRHCPFPQHFKANMLGHLKSFERIDT